MKVAVVSNQVGQVGKSVLSLLLSLTFSYTQQRQAIILSTGNCSELYAQCSIDKSQDGLRNTNIYKALMQNAALQGDDILDYADRIGKTNVFAFNIFDAQIEKEQLEALFCNTLDSLKSELILVEVSGDLKSNLNRQVLEMCDAILYVFNPNQYSIHAMQDYKTNFDRNCVVRTGYVCQQYCPDMISENRIVKTLGIDKKCFMYLPYNEAVVKACYYGEIESLVKPIVSGAPETISLRNKLLELMQYLFDAPNYKYIKGYTDWPQ